MHVWGPEVCVHRIIGDACALFLGTHNYVWLFAYRIQFYWARRGKGSEGGQSGGREEEIYWTRCRMFSQASSQTTPTPTGRQQPLYEVCQYRLTFVFYWILSKWNPGRDSFLFGFCSSPFAPEVHACCVYPNATTLYCWVALHHLAIPPFAYLLMDFWMVSILGLKWTKL